MADDKFYANAKDRRLLEERSYLKFVFPGIDERLPTEFTLPFYENVRISESQSANYVKYDLLARSSSLYSYAGSPSRRIKLNFNITTPHLLDFAKDATPMKYIDGPAVDNKIKAQEDFNIFLDDLERGDVNDEWGVPDRGAGVDHEGGIRNATAARQRYHRALMNKKDPGSWDANPKELKNYYEAYWPESVGSADDSQAAEISNSRSMKKSDENVLNVLVWWINLIRASTKNNAENVILGPPIIRLNHGPLYNDIPCVCTSYKIDPDNSAGFEKITLLERIIKVSMDLEEIRTGDLLSEYVPSDIIKMDNNAGWEALIKHNTTDPYGDTEFTV